jgi:perosamine synthetase
MPEEYIGYGKQTLYPEDIAAVMAALADPFLTQGPAVKTFENAVSDYCGVQYAVAFSSGTAALHGACMAAGLKKGDEAITSCNTFVASSNAMIYVGATPVFVDIDPQTYNLDLNRVREAITPQTKVLMPVHFAGLPVDLDALYALAEEKNLIVIEDASHALGAAYHKTRIGNCKDMAVFSFHPVKSVTTGEGGVVTTNNPVFYEKLLTFRTHGITKKTADFKCLEPDPWVYEMHSLGFNYRLTDFQAALGTSQMKHLQSFIERRNTLARRYQEAFSPFQEAIRFQQPATSGVYSAFHLFVIRLLSKQAQADRLALYMALKNQGILTQVHYIPVHLHPYYRETFATAPGDFPMAEAYYNSCLSLPLYPDLTEAQQDRIIHAVLTFLKK